MLTVGDATNGNSAQDTNVLTGKILRLNIDGSIPVDNPFGGSPVWSTGHRNPQGLAFTGMGRLFSSEHGDAIGDELNLIKKGRNYGWPHVEGFCDTEKEQLFCKTHAVTAPVKAWTPVIAPAGITYCGANCSIKEWRNALLLVTLKTQSLRVLKLNEAGTEVIAEQVYLDHEFGRLRGVCVSPAGEVYVSTSNRDWNPGEGYPKQVDDRIIKILPGDSINSGFVQQKQVKPALADGAVVYNNYCVSCHKNDGEGLEGVFPPLRGTQEVLGDKNRLIKIILKGLSGPVTIKGRKYDQQMPAFDFLSDREIALVATYVRTHFGNSAENITGAHVAKVRGAGKK
jgi:mono/diheme cytochrome c family protein